LSGRKKFVRTLALKLLGLVLFLGLLHLGFVRKLILNHALHSLERNLGVSVQAASLHYNLLVLRFTFTEIVLRHPEDPGRPAFLTAERITARISPSLLFKGKIRLQELACLRPRLNVEISEEGKAILPFRRPAEPRKIPAMKPAAPPEFVLRSASIQDAALYLDDRKKGLKIALEGLDLRARWMGGGVHRLSVKTEKEGSIEYRGRRFPVETLKLAADVGRLDVSVLESMLKVQGQEFSITGQVKDYFAPVFDLDLDGRLALEYLKPLLQAGAELAGRITLQTRLEGPVSMLKARAEVMSEGLSVGELSRVFVKAELLWQQGALGLPFLEMVMPGASLKGTGEALMSGPLQAPSGQVSGRFEADIEDLAVFWPPLRSALESLKITIPELGKASGRVHLAGQVSGPLSSPRLTSRITGSDVSIAGLEDLALEGILVYERESLLFNPLVITNGEGRIHVEGAYGFDAPSPLDLSIEARKVPAEVIFKSLGLAHPPQGVVALKARVTGRLDAPVFTLQTSWSDFVYRGQRIPELSLDARSNGEDARFSMDVPFLSAFVQGILSFRPPYPLRLEVRIDDFLFEKIESLISPPGLAGMAGALSARAELRGDLARLEETLRWSVGVEKLRIQTAGIELASAGDFSVSFDREGLALKGLEIRDIQSQSIALQAEGNLPLRDGQDSEIHLLARVEVERLASLIPGMEARGVLSLDSRIIGSVFAPQVRAAVDVDGGAWTFKEGLKPVEDVRASLEITENILRIRSLSFRWGSGQYALIGNVPFESLPFGPSFLSRPSEKREARLTLSVNRFKLSDAEAVFRAEGFRGIDGEADAEVEIRGDCLAPERISAEARISSFHLDFSDIPLTLKPPGRLLYREGRLSLEPMRFAGADSEFQAEGWMDLLGEKNVFFLLRGRLELGLLQAFLGEGTFSGRAAFETRCEGRFPELDVNGILELQEAGLELSAAGVSLHRLNGRIGLGRDRIALTGISGELNGGRMNVEGEITHAALRLVSADVQISAEHVFADYPPGLFSESNLDLRFVSDGGKHALSGKVSLAAAEYVEDLSVQSELYRYLRRRGTTEFRRGKRSAFLNNLNFDVRVVTPGSVAIQNNLLKAQLNADLRLLGSPYEPGLAGRILFSEGGEIFFSRRTYLIERGEINFLNPSRIEPELDIRAHTRVSGYAIQLLLAGNPDDFSARLISDPPLSEPDIISLLITGKRLAYISEAGLGFVSDQALSYVDNAITGRLEKFAEQKLGFQNVTIDAGLVSTQENPEARITIGQQITPRLDLVVSQNLKRSQYRTVILNYSPARDFNLRGIKKDSDEVRLETHHEVRFGLEKSADLDATGELKAPLIENVSFEGNLGFAEGGLRRRLNLKPGSRFDFFSFRKDLEELRRLYAKNDYLSSTISPRREEKDGKLSLIYRIEAGPKVNLRYEGTHFPRGLKRQTERVWAEGRFQKRILEKAVDLQRRYFHARGYYQARIETEESGTGENQVNVTFRVFPGTRYKDLRLRLDGNVLLSDASLESFLKGNKLDLEALINPEKVASRLRDFYVERGFLSAEAWPARVEFFPQGRTAQVSLPIAEGPRFKVASMVFNGHRALTEEELAGSVRMRTGSVFSPRELDDALSVLRSAYARKGFNSADIREHVQVDEAAASVSVAWEISENDQDVIENVEITGNAITDTGTIRRELILDPGEPLDFLKLHKSQKSLYDLQVFERVSFTLSSVEEKKDNQGGKRYHRVEFHVAEMQPCAFRYGLQHDTETGPGATGEILNRNFFGRAHLLGASFTLSRREKGIKGFFRSQYFLGKKINTELFTFANRSIQPGFSLDRGGFTVQQQFKLAGLWFLTYNYTLERSRVFEAAPDVSPLDRPLNIGRLSVAVSRDTRDDILDPGRGSFLSQSVEYAAPLVGSDREFLRSYSQFFFVHNIAGSLRYASGLRVGLAKGFRHDLPLSERFFAGGGTSVRGFSLNQVGPRAPESQVPVGGEALFILNQELRYPVYKHLGGVVFLDLGNVYVRVSDWNPFSVRPAAGVGLRLNTPILALRLDWGFKLDRRPGESRSAIHFSIGQAF